MSKQIPFPSINLLLTWPWI